MSGSGRVRAGAGERWSQAPDAAPTPRRPRAFPDRIAVVRAERLKVIQEQARDRVVEAAFEAAPSAGKPATGVARSAPTSSASLPFTGEDGGEEVPEGGGGLALPLHGVAGFAAAGSGAETAGTTTGGDGGRGSRTGTATAASGAHGPRSRGGSLRVRRLSEGLALSTAAAAARVATSPLQAGGRSSRAPAGPGARREGPTGDAAPELEREKERLRQMAERQNKEIERTIWAERAVRGRLFLPPHPGPVLCG